MFIYMVQYGEHYEGIFGSSIFSSVEPALAYARGWLPRLGRMGIAVIHEYHAPENASEAWDHTQTCLVHQDEEWVTVGEDGE